MCTGNHHVQLAVLKVKVFSWKIKRLKVFMCINSTGSTSMLRTADGSHFIM